MGDAGKLANEDAPEQGVVFDGRTAENFKLTSGTWVHVGELRIALITACSPFVAVVPGDHRIRDERALAEGLARCNAGRGSAAQITRARVLREPPSIDHGEITDKGYINQRAVLARRADEVAALYSGDCVVVAGIRT